MESCEATAWPHKYFPDLQEGEYPDRAFLWGILGTLRNDACKKLINDARVSRSKNNEEEKDDLIEVHPDFLDKLIMAPITSKSKMFIWKFNQ